MVRSSHILAWLLCLAPLGSCALLPLSSPSKSRPGGYPAPVRAGLLEFRATFHCHSYLSDDSDGTLEEITNAARRNGLQIVLLTDHYEPNNISSSPRGMHDGVLFVPGVETRLGGGASLLAVAPLRDFEEGDRYRERFASLREDHAFLVAGHVEGLAEGYDLDGFTGFEVFNLHAQTEATSVLRIVPGLLFLTIDCFLESLVTNPTLQLERWDRELRERKLAALAGHDAHANVRLFGPLGGTIGTYSELFRLFSTRILAEELSEDAVLEALRAGHTWVGFDHLGDPAGFSMRYGSGGSRWSIPGDSAEYAPGHSLEVRVPQRCKIRVLRDGVTMTEQLGRRLDISLPGPGTYRVEAYRRDRIWIISSPIYIDGTDG